MPRTKQATGIKALTVLLLAREEVDDKELRLQQLLTDYAVGVDAGPDIKDKLQRLKNYYKLLEDAFNHELGKIIRFAEIQKVVCQA